MQALCSRENTFVCVGQFPKQQKQCLYYYTEKTIKIIMNICITKKLFNGNSEESKG